MAIMPGPARIVRFGDIEADLDAGEIVRDGRRISLPDQPLRILIRLIGRPGSVISRDELRRELWADDTYVDFEHGLNSAIKRLRDGLGDSADAPRYIETVPRRGYRFVGRIEVEPTPALEPQPAPQELFGSAERSRRAWVAMTVLLALCMMAWVWLAYVRPGSSTQHAAAPLVSSRVLVAVLEPTARGRSPSAVEKLAADQLIAVISRAEAADVVPAAVLSPSSDDTLGSARRNGAAIAVELVCRTLAADQFFEARIHDTLSREVLYFSPRFKGPEAQPAAAVEQLAQAVAGAIAIHLDPAFGGLHLTSEPPVLDAYIEYRAGSALMDKDYPRAIAQLQRASQLSPGFLLPRLTLVMAYDNQGDHANRSAQMAQIADTAQRLSPAERLLVEYMIESLARRPASALRALLELEKLAPRSWIVNYGIQQEALRLHRPSVAIEAFARLPLDDRYRRFNAWRLAVLTRALHLVGDYKREAAESRRAQEHEPGNALYAADEVRALSGLGDVAGVDKVIDRSLATPPTTAGPTIVIERAARELRAHGRRQQSLDVANRGVEWLRTRHPTDAQDLGHQAALARMLYLAERWPEAETLFARLAERSDSLEYAGYLGVIAARRLDRRRAADSSERLHQWQGPDLHGRHTYWLAAIAALLGERDRAVTLLREAFGQGHGRGLQIHESPDFETLRDYAPFVELVAPRHDVGSLPRTYRLNAGLRTANRD